MFKKLLVCLDGSAHAEQILAYVEELSMRFDSHVTLLDISHTEHDAHRVIPISDSRKDETEEYLGKKAKPLREKGIEVECVAISAEYPVDKRRDMGVDTFPLPGETTRAIGKSILDFAREHKVDSIAISTHGKSGWRRALFGSIAEFLLEHSHLPLLVLRPQIS